jgi:large subunit ribosomal protein L46
MDGWSARMLFRSAPRLSQLTRTPTQFEQAYYAYQARMRHSLHNPFPFYFYFKQGSLLEMHFNLEEQKCERLAFGPAFLEEESVSEEKKAADKAAVEQLLLQEGEGEDLMPRTHPADVNNNVKSLDRRGKRNLYLLLLTLQRLAIRKTEKMYGNFLKVI